MYSPIHSLSIYQVPTQSRIELGRGGEDDESDRPMFVAVITCSQSLNTIKGTTEISGVFTPLMCDSNDRTGQNGNQSQITSREDQYAHGSFHFHFLRSIFIDLSSLHGFKEYFVII